MTRAPDQILSVVGMRAAEEALIAAGTSVDALMAVAGHGAAEYVWRMAAGRRVTVLTGPGNNGGDGWVIAETLRHAHVPVAVVAAHEPRTEAARHARALYGGQVLAPGDVLSGDAVAGEVLVDCLFGSGLTRALDVADAALLAKIAAQHPHRIAIDVPSGVDSDTGACLNDMLPDYKLTVALGAWKFAHFLMPAAASMGALRLVGIGCAPVPGAATVLRRPALGAPLPDAHKYARGLLAVVAGAMPGAALLAARAAQGAGAGYVKLMAPGIPDGLPADLVLEVAGEARELGQNLGDVRISGLLVGPGLGRDEAARGRLKAVLAVDKPTVLDADALMLVSPGMMGGGMARGRLIATPHGGEMVALERAFGLRPEGSKVDRTRALARSSGMVIVAKGPDTVIAGPDGETLCAPRATSWLSTAGTGDVLAGAIASRLACGVAPFEAAAQGVWLHGEAARAIVAPFSASALAGAVPGAYAAAR